jgi:hypothetical protein
MSSGLAVAFGSLIVLTVLSVAIGLYISRKADRLRMERRRAAWGKSVPANIINPYENFCATQKLGEKGELNDEWNVAFGSADLNKIRVHETKSTQNIGSKLNQGKVEGRAN